MGAYKDFLIGVEELVWSALEKGMTDEENIYSYVYMHGECYPGMDTKYTCNVV